MDRQPTPNERILEAIEACRPGSDDVADPSLAFLADALEADAELEQHYGRVQRLDETLAGVFRDVPTPEGLRQRVLDGLAAERAAEAVSADSARLLEAMAEQREPVATVKPRRVSRRWLTAGLVVTPLAAALVVFVLSHLNSGQAYTKTTVLQEAQEFFLNEKPQPGYALTSRDHPMPTRFPVSRDVRPGTQAVMRWRWVEGFLERKAVAYDMPSGRVRLYAVRLDLDEAPVFPPPRAAESTSGRCSVSLWKDGSVLYILVVDGDSRDYEQFYRQHLIAPRGPIT